MCLSIKMLLGYIVVIKRNGEDGTKFPLLFNCCVFGRGPECDIRIQLPDVSKEHCKIEIVESQAILKVMDEIPENTLVNESPVLENIVLNHGDIITISERKFRFEYPLWSPYVKNDLVSSNKYKILTPKHKPDSGLNKRNTPVQNNVKVTSSKRNFKRSKSVGSISNKVSSLNHSSVSKLASRKSDIVNLRSSSGKNTMPKKFSVENVSPVLSKESEQKSAKVTASRKRGRSADMGNALSKKRKSSSSRKSLTADVSELNQVVGTAEGSVENLSTIKRSSFTPVLKAAVTPRNLVKGSSTTPNLSVKNTPKSLKKVKEKSISMTPKNKLRKSASTVRDSLKLLSDSAKEQEKASENVVDNVTPMNLSENSPQSLRKSPHISTSENSLETSSDDSEEMPVMADVSERETPKASITTREARSSSVIETSSKRKSLSEELTRKSLDKVKSAERAKPSRRNSTSSKNTANRSDTPAVFLSKKVKFGPALSPEHFDKTLPPFTPVKRGGLPRTPFRRVSAASQVNRRKSWQNKSIAEESEFDSIESTPKMNEKREKLSTPGKTGSSKKVKRDSVRKPSPKSRVTTPAVEMSNDIKVSTTVTPDEQKSKALLVVHAAKLKASGHKISTPFANRNKYNSFEIVRSGTKTPSRRSSKKPLFSDVLKKGIRNGAVQKKGLSNSSKSKKNKKVSVTANRLVKSRPSSARKKKVSSKSTGHALSPETLFIGKKKTSKNVVERRPRRGRKSTSVVAKDSGAKSLEMSFTGLSDLMKTPGDKIKMTPQSRQSIRLSSIDTPKTPSEINISPLSSEADEIKTPKTPLRRFLNEQLETANLCSSDAFTLTPNELIDSKCRLINSYGTKKSARSSRKKESPQPDYTNVSGIKRLMRTPRKSPQSDYTNVSGVKRLMRTPRKSPVADYTNVEGVKRIMKTPRKSPVADYTNVSGVKRIMRTPRQSPVADYTNVLGVKRLMRGRTSPLADYTNVIGVKRLMSTPDKSPKSDCSSIPETKTMTAKSSGSPKTVSAEVMVLIESIVKSSDVDSSDVSRSEALNKTSRLLKKLSIDMKDELLESQALNSPRQTRNVSSASSKRVSKSSRGVEYGEKEINVAGRRSRAKVIKKAHKQGASVSEVVEITEKMTSVKPISKTKAAVKLARESLDASDVKKVYKKSQISPNLKSSGKSGKSFMLLKRLSIDMVTGFGMTPVQTMTTKVDCSVLKKTSRRSTNPESSLKETSKKSSRSLKNLIIDMTSGPSESPVVISPRKMRNASSASSKGGSKSSRGIDVAGRRTRANVASPDGKGTRLRNSKEGRKDETATLEPVEVTMKTGGANVLVDSAQSVSPVSKKMPEKRKSVEIITVIRGLRSNKTNPKPKISSDVSSPEKTGQKLKSASVSLEKMIDYESETETSVGTSSSASTKRTTRRGVQKSTNASQRNRVRRSVEILEPQLKKTRSSRKQTTSPKYSEDTTPEVTLVKMHSQNQRKIEDSTDTSARNETESKRIMTRSRNLVSSGKIGKEQFPKKTIASKKRKMPPSKKSDSKVYFSPSRQEKTVSPVRNLRKTRSRK